MGYLDGLDADCCPFCMRSLDEFVSSKSYVGKYITIDVPTDMVVAHAVSAKEFLYACCKKWNEETKGKVRFNLESLR